MSTQHIATLLGATCCARLATMLRRVATCWVLLAQVWRWSNLSQQHPTYRNTMQHGGQTRATCCAQQCCDMLRWHVAIVWPGLYFFNKYSLSLYVYTRGLLGCLFGFWPLGQNPAGANRVFIAMHKKDRFVFNLVRFTNGADSVNPYNLIMSTSLNP